MIYKKHVQDGEVVFSFLPEIIVEELKKYSGSIREIRLRTGYVVSINVNGVQNFVKLKNCITASDFEKIILKITEHSIYAHTQSLSQGFLTTKNGLRVGIAGTAVVENDKVKIIKEVSSICIRVPNEIVGCSDYLMQSVFHSGLKNLLIISPPGIGKTTLVRDLCRNLSEKFNYNVLIVDERREIFSPNFRFGNTVDCLIASTKYFGFNMGVRTMCPDVIAVDELFTQTDVEGVINAVSSGVWVLASVHGKSVEDIKSKTQLKNLIDNKLFDYAVILTNVGKRGEVVKLR